MLLRFAKMFWLGKTAQFTKHKHIKIEVFVAIDRQFSYLKDELS